MSAKVVTALDGSGRLLAVKHGASAHEAERLAALRHPGVVEFVAFQDDQGTLSTVLVGTHSLATAGRIDPERAAGLIAALAVTIADLHDLGVVHGRLEPSHVLLGPAGRPVVCSFSGAAGVGEPPPQTPPVAEAFADPAAAPCGPAAPGTDVYGLGALLTWMLDGAAPDFEPIPAQRLAWSPGRRRWSGWERRALLNLADQATADDPSVRPTARELAAAVVAAVPGAHLTDARGGPAPPPSEPGPPKRPRGLMALAGVGLVLLVWGASMVRTGPTGNGSDEPVAVDGGVVEVGGARYAVGQKGDQVTVGDWDCDGRATVALLRPGTGEVFVFPGWAEPGHDLTVSAVQTVTAARRLIAASGEGECPALVVETATGQRVEVAA